MTEPINNNNGPAGFSDSQGPGGLQGAGGPAPAQGFSNPFEAGQLPPALENWRQKFNSSFGGQEMSPAQFMKFIQGIEKMINAQIKQEDEQMRKASQKLKESETGQD